MTGALRKEIKRATAQAVKDARPDRVRLNRDNVAAIHYFQLMAQARDRVESGLYGGERREKRIVVSLTSISTRLFDVATTIESMLCQTLRPDVIVLWLDQDTLTREEIPISLKKQEQHGLSIRFCEDIGPHTKLVPALREFPNDIIVTVDDDILYPDTFLERLYRAYLKEPTTIHCTRARQIHIPLKPPTLYSKHWPNLLEERTSLDVVPLGVGGVLYPPHSLASEVFDLDAQRRLCPRADDIWFKAMSLKQGVPCHRIALPKEPFSIRPNSQDNNLEQENVAEGGNDRQIKGTFDAYRLWDVLDGAERI